MNYLWGLLSQYQDVLICKEGLNVNEHETLSIIKHFEEKEQYFFNNRHSLQNSLNILKGQSESVYRRRTQRSKEKVQKDIQRTTQHMHKTKDRVTRTHKQPGVNSGAPGGFSKWNVDYSLCILPRHASQ